MSYAWTVAITLIVVGLPVFIDSDACAYASFPLILGVLLAVALTLLQLGAWYL